MSYSLNNHMRIDTLVEKLRYRLKNFTVINLHGEKLGEVKDVILDANRQLNLVVSQSAGHQNSRLFLLVSKLITKIEPANKTVLVDLTSADVTNLPAYAAPITLDKKLSESSANPIMPVDESVDTGIRQDSERLDDSSLVSELTDIKPAAPLFEVPDMQNEVQANMLPNSSQEQDILGEEIIRLLGERLVVERNKRKVGEVIVRKEIETRMVQVPVRYEKLIVEQVSPEHKQLVEIDLGQEAVPQEGLPEATIGVTQTPSTSGRTNSLDGKLTVSGTFNSPKIASLLLNAIALERQHRCQQVRVEIVVEDAERQKTYQEWFDRISIKS